MTILGQFDIGFGSMKTWIFHLFYIGNSAGALAPYNTLDSTILYRPVKFLLSPSTTRPSARQGAPLPLYHM